METSGLEFYFRSSEISGDAHLNPKLFQLNMLIRRFFDVVLDVFFRLSMRFGRLFDVCFDVFFRLNMLFRRFSDVFRLFFQSRR